MRTHATAAILSIGDELILGQTLDTNSRWLAARLLDLGVTTVEHATVPDDLPRHADAISRLASQVDLIISTGGLGPTADDLTRQALARAMDDVLVEDATSLAEIESIFASLKRPMPELNRVQALRPAGAAAISNPNGTAPGLRAVVGRSEVFCLPGPPSEMKPMFEAAVVPALRPPPGRTVRTRVFHCIGIGESALATRLGPLMDRERVPLVGTTASGGVVSCRVRYEGPLDSAAADAAMDQTEREIRAAAGQHIFGAGEQTLAGAIVTMLKSRGQTLGCVESCTGGLLGAAVTDVSGASAVFVGGLVTYANAAKAGLAHVPITTIEQHGAVSRETAAAMAVGGLDALGADHCLAVTGIAGPQGGSPEKPVGTVWIARAARGGEPEARRFLLPGDRESVRRWSVTSALAVLWQHLEGRDLRLLRQV